MTLFMMLRKQPRHTLHGSFNVVGRSTTEPSEDVIANQITECRKYLFFFLFFLRPVTFLFKADHRQSDSLWQCVFIRHEWNEVWIKSASTL